MILDSSLHTWLTSLLTCYAVWDYGWKSCQNSALRTEIKRDHCMLSWHLDMTNCFVTVTQPPGWKPVSLCDMTASNHCIFLLHTHTSLLQAQYRKKRNTAPAWYLIIHCKHSTNSEKDQRQEGVTIRTTQISEEQLIFPYSFEISLTVGNLHT